MAKGLFCVVAGPRLGGKTTAAGTLPGKTLILQAAVKESGSRSAQALAKKRGNVLEVQTFNDLLDLRAKLEKAAKGDYNHLYLDGYSAINDMRWGEADIQALFKKNAWDAYAKFGQDMTSICEWIKGYTYGDNGKNLFLTCALKIKTDMNGAATDVELECKGKVAITQLTKLGEAVVSVMQVPTEAGPKRVLITRTWEQYPGRIDGVLDEDNPGHIDPELGQVLKLTEGDY